MTQIAQARSMLFCAGTFAVILVLTTLCSCMIRKTAAPEYFATEEKLLTAQIDDKSDPNVLSDLYARRARLRIRADNPHVDYQGALRDFESSLNLNPGQWNAGKVRDWIAALSRITALERDAGKIKAKYEQSESRNRTLTGTVEQLEKQEKELRKSVAQLEQSIEQLEKSIEQLEKKEKELRKSIEELQSLELQMEQRRQQLR
jgi:chromosome segregation ATPase